MDIPYFILEEIISLLDPEDQSELLTLNKKSCKILISYMSRNLRISHPMSDTFYNIILPTFGSRVRSLEIAFFDKKAIQVLPNIKKIKILDNYQETLEEDIGDILKQYPRLTELDLSGMLLKLEFVPLICFLKKLVFLKLPDFFDELHQVHTLLEFLKAPSLRSLFLEVPTFVKEAFGLIAKNLPNLVRLGILTDVVPPVSTSMLNIKLLNLRTFEFVSKSNERADQALQLKLANFPRLKNFCVSPLISLEATVEHVSPIIEEFATYHLDKNLSISVLRHFSCLSSLKLVCDDIIPKVIKELLPNLTTLKRLELHRVRDSSVFVDLPLKKYMVHTFSLIDSCPVQPEFFFWVSSYFPHLHRLAVEFDLRSHIPCDAIPYNLETPFQSLSKLYLGGHFPAAWIHHLINQSPILDILGLDSDLYTKHSKRLFRRYPSLDISLTSEFHQSEEEYSDSETESDVED